MLPFCLSFCLSFLLSCILSSFFPPVFLSCIFLFFFVLVILEFRETRGSRRADFTLEKNVTVERNGAQKKWYFSESDIFESVIPSRSKAAKAHFLFKGKKPNCSKLWGGDGVATSHCEKNRIVLNFEKCLFLEPRTPLVRETDRY